MAIEKQTPYEHKIQSDIMVALSQNGCTIFRTNTGKVKIDEGEAMLSPNYRPRFFSTGTPAGYPDLTGFRHSDGKIIFIEVKDIKGKRRDDQIKFAKIVTKFPVLYGVARSVEDALEIISK